MLCLQKCEKLKLDNLTWDELHGKYLEQIARAGVTADRLYPAPYFACKKAWKGLRLQLCNKVYSCFNVSICFIYFCFSLRFLVCVNQSQHDLWRSRIRKLQKRSRKELFKEIEGSNFVWNSFLCFVAWSYIIFPRPSPILSFWFASPFSGSLASVSRYVFLHEPGLYLL